MPIQPPVVVPPGCVRRVKRPQGNDHNSSCHCSLNASALFGTAASTGLTPPIPLSRCQIHELQSCLPQRYQTTVWDPIFDTAVDGFSLHHFYRQASVFPHSAGLCILVVTPRDEQVLPAPSMSSPRQQFQESFPYPPLTGLDGTQQRNDRKSVIGCFTSEVPNLRHNPHQFYGSRETFVFRTSQEHGGIQTFPWNGTDNEEFILSSSHFLGVGGGKEGAAIFLDEALQFGTSSVHCATFDCSSLFGRPKGGLHHSEFLVVRMVWFALRTRVHTEYGGTERPGAASLNTWYASLHDDAPTPCMCGRGAHKHHCTGGAI
ncbi:Hypothetical protein, putative [Bodo saltans]|uniref:Oxidation resistance protein 1 n=1 Tax=Bodo saltans TaxID=75058 RepID=A0A0S4JA80_BODSA|nr:Hypothetical protein, putative [Bodo saltans]|eukprot:CUG86893.1 Hypothetical protein, putative [Bodo saltans]